ncbi:MAG TPA: MAPEG family protein [Dokdonella sp.]|nr:MAPEG family protein [Dokdonella sp.]
MSVELKMLAWAIVLGLVQLLVAASFATAQRGLRWNVGPRDAAQTPLTGLAGRLDRAAKNFLETFAFFAVAVLMLASLNRADPHTALGAQLYFWARLAYVPAYAIGVPFLRTAIWAVSLAGLFMVVAPLL